MNVLITGSSDGLGKDLAVIFDKLGYNVVLMGRDLIKLKKLKEQLNNKTNYLVGDLLDESFQKKVAQYILNNKIDILVNNVGIGSIGFFEELNDYDDLIKLNCIVPTMLAKAFLSKGKGRLINISSIAALQSDPFMAVYGATKSYLFLLSRSLHVEYKNNKNVIIQVCLPGGFSSNFYDGFNVKKYQIDSMKVARAIVRDAFKNKPIIVPLITNKIAYYTSKMLPNWVIDAIEYKIQLRKMIK